MSQPLGGLLPMLPYRLLAGLLSVAMTVMANPRILVFTATTGYRHDSIPTAIQVLGDLASSWDVTFDFTEDGGMFTNDTLSQFDGVMFISTSGANVLDDTQQSALTTFFQSGGVFTGVHSSTDCLNNDETYGQVIGAYFDYHPTIQSATFLKTNESHPSTAGLPDRWTYEEEVYYFKSDPRSNGAVVVLTVDESSYTNNGTSTGNYPSQGDPHPIAWYIESPQSAQPLLDGAPKAGRSFYTSLGHLNFTWQDQTFTNHVMSGLMWALQGASTKAYGTGLVGSPNNTDASGTSSSATPSSSASQTTSGGSSQSGSATSAAASAAGSSGAASYGISRPSGAAGLAGLALGAVGAGIALVF